MSGQVTSDLYAVVDLSKKKTKKPASNQDRHASDPDVMMYDVLSSNDQKDKRDVKDNEPKLSKEKSKIYQALSSYKVVISILIITWIVLVITFVMVINVYLSMGNPQQNDLSIISSLIREEGIRRIINEAFSNWSNLSRIVARQDDFNTAVNNFYNIIENITYNLSLFEIEVTEYHFSSCSQALSKDSSYLSGNYILRSSTGALRNVYCDMTNRFGGDSKGWMRVAKLDVNNCPPGLMAYTSGSIKTCVVTKDNAGCTEIVYSTAKISYAEITGRIRGYQIGTLDGFIGINDPPRSMNISANYVDGISVISNNEHIWTFAAGCDCTHTKPDTIGSNYTCDKPPSCNVGVFCTTHLWESQKCGNTSQWFLRTLDNPATTDINVRVCRNQDRPDEDLAISTLELYVQ